MHWRIQGGRRYNLNEDGLLAQVLIFLFVQGDYHNIEHSDNYFDKAYALEATCHSADLIKVYSEIYRVLKPGGLFVCCEWIMTEEYDSTNAYHRKLKDDILVSCKYFTKN